MVTNWDQAITQGAEAGRHLTCFQERQAISTGMDLKWPKGLRKQKAEPQAELGFTEHTEQ